MLGLSYMLLLTSIWRALAFQKYCAGTMLSDQDRLGSGRELDEIKKRLRWTQALFLAGIIFFGILAGVAFAGWVFANQSP